MSDTNPTNTAPNLQEQPEKKRNLTPIYILVIAALLASNAYFYFNGKRVEGKQEALIATDTARINDLTGQFNAAKITINSYKDQNTQLDDSIKKIESDLSGVKASLMKARATGQLSEAEYQKEKKILAMKIKELNSMIDDLQKKLNVQVVKNDSMGKVLTDKEMQNADLAGKYKVASAKVDIASALHASSIEAHAIIIKKSGKEVETSRASKAEKIKVTFSVDENKVTESGKKTIYVRLITPEGTSIYNESEGSGTMTSATGDAIRYSAKGDFDYSNAQKSLFLYVKSGTGFAKGKYTVELYERGYSIGTSSFNLK